MVSVNLDWLLACLKLLGMGPVATWESTGQEEMVGMKQKASRLLSAFLIAEMPSLLPKDNP